jgi:hypothetical protein
MSTHGNGQAPQGKDKTMTIAQIKSQMIAAGWNYNLSVTRTASHGTKYGLLFTKGGEKFYLNNETRDSLPA